VNINIGIPGFSGGELVISENGSSDDEDDDIDNNVRYDQYDDEFHAKKQKAGHKVQHTVGQALLHHGKIHHGAAPLHSGERMNIIMWLEIPAKFHKYLELAETVQFEILSRCSLLDLMSVLQVSQQMHKISTCLGFWIIFYTQKKRILG